MPTAQQLLAAYLRSDEGERRRFERAAGLQRRRCVSVRQAHVEQRCRAVHAIILGRGGPPGGTPRARGAGWGLILDELRADWRHLHRICTIKRRTLREQYFRWLARQQPDVDASTCRPDGNFPRISGPPAQETRKRRLA